MESAIEDWTGHEQIRATPRCGFSLCPCPPLATSPNDRDDAAPAADGVVVWGYVLCRASTTCYRPPVPCHFFFFQVSAHKEQVFPMPCMLVISVGNYCVGIGGGKFRGGIVRRNWRGLGNCLGGIVEIRYDC